MLSSATPPACTLQVSSRGIRVCDFDEKQQSLKSSPKAPKKNKGKDKEKLKVINPQRLFEIFAVKVKCIGRGVAKGGGGGGAVLPNF